MTLNQDWVFLTDQLIKFATVSSPNPTAADMPLSYTYTSQQPTDRVRFTDVTVPIVIDIDISDPIARQYTKLGLDSWRLIELLFNNSNSTGTWRVKGAANLASIGSPTYDSGVFPLWPSNDCQNFSRIHSYLWVPVARSETYLRITINDTTPRKQSLSDPSGFTTATYFDIGQILVGYGYANGDYGGDTSNRKGTLSTGLDEEARILTSEGGPIFPRIRPKSDKRSFILAFGGDNARYEYLTAMQHLRRDRGVSQALTFIENINNRGRNGSGLTHKMEDITYGLFTSLQDTAIRDLNYYELVIGLRGML